MNAILPLLSLAVLGVDTGWTSLEGGGHEYIIQIEPELLKLMQQGKVVASDIPPELRGARRYRIVVGDGPLPGQGTAPPRQPPEKPPAVSPAEPPTPAKPTHDMKSSPPPDDAFSAERGNSGKHETHDDRPAWSGPLDAADSPPPGNRLDDDQAAHRPPELFGARGDVKPLADHTGFQQTQDASAVEHDGHDHAHEDEHEDEDDPGHAAEAGADREDSSPAPAVGGARPWAALVLTLLVLFGSLALNVILGWNFWETRQRYRRLVAGTA